MKKVLTLVFVLVVAVLCAAFAGCGENNIGGNADLYRQINYDNTGDLPKVDELLDGAEYEGGFGSGECYTFDATADNVKAYAAALEKAGFSSYEKMDEILLSDGQLLIDLRLFSENDGCELSFIKAGKIEESGLISPDKAAKKLKKEAVGVLLECEDKELYSKTGLQIFYCCEEPEEDMYKENYFDHTYYLIGKNDYCKIYYDPFYPIAVEDINNDGAEEIIFTGYGYTSGAFTCKLNAYSAINGKIEKIAERTFEYPVSVFKDDEGRIKLKKEINDKKTEIFDLSISQSDFIIS